VSASKVIAPTTFGATVNRLVLTVEYPRLATICGKKLLTLAKGTPSVKLTPAQTLNNDQTQSANYEGQDGTVIPIHWIFKGSETVAKT